MSGAGFILKESGEGMRAWDQTHLLCDLVWGDPDVLKIGLLGTGFLWATQVPPSWDERKKAQMPSQTDPPKTPCYSLFVIDSIY